MSFDPQEAAGQEAEKADGKKSKVASIKPVTRAEWENKISKYLEGLGFTRISDTQILNKDGQFLRVLPTGQVVPLYRALAEPGRITKFVVETSEGYDKKQHLTAGVIFDPRDRFVSGLTSDVNDQTLIKNKDQIAKARTIPAQLILAGF